MRVVSAISCFAAAGPLLRAPLPLATTAVGQNDVPAAFRHLSAHRTGTGRGDMSMLFEQKARSRPRRTSSACIMANSDREANHSALMTRGGTTASETSAYRRAKAFVNKRFFLCGAATMVALAKLAPSFGTTGGPLSLVVSKAGEGGTGTRARNSLDVSRSVSPRVQVKPCPRSVDSKPAPHM